MFKTTAFIMSLITAFSLYFGTAGSPDYTKSFTFNNMAEAFINKNDIIGSSHTGQVSSEKWSETDVYSLDDTSILIKEKDKDFIILNLSDIHFTDYDKKSTAVPNTIANIRKMVATVRPDLITVTGDIVCSDSTYYSVRLFTDLMESFGIPWAPVFGNHDGEGNCDLNYLADIMMTSPHCLLKKGDPDLGIGNYIINIAEENEDGSLKIIESVVMLFSHNHVNNEKQLRWYKWAADGVNKLSGNSAEISIFCHIPLAEYQYAYDMAWDDEKKQWRQGYGAYGALGENVAYGTVENGIPSQKDFFSILKETGTAKYVFCGHDHLNNFSILYQGIRLTYSMKIGAASGNFFMFNGGTQITVGNRGITSIRQKSLALGPVITLHNIDTK